MDICIKYFIYLTVFVLFVQTVQISNSKKYRSQILTKFSTRLDLNSQQPIVKIRNGMTIIGRVNETVDEHKRYYSFRAIPFALPPIENLRFMPPVALSGNLSNKLVNASEYGADCIQVIDTYTSEDCLYLNVYIPQFKNSSSLRPVMVWIYGGAFVTGGSKYSDYGPDYLLNEDVIVVTFNYRLGVFGFLSTEDNAAPGNYGLKDQILALQWVHENIVYFGGNASRITLFGESAGAASSSYLSQSPLTEGLFHGVILESGTSINSWALTRNSRELAFITATLLHVNTSTSQTLIDGLRNIDARKLQNAVTIALLEGYVVNNPINGIPFGPTIEPIHPGAVVINYSHENLKNGGYHKVPYIIGFNSLEAIPFVELLNRVRLYLLKYDILPTELVPASLNIYDPVTKLIVSFIIRNYYFGATPVAISEKSLLQYISDDMFVRPILEATLLYSQQAPVYLYKFSYQGSLGRENRKVAGVGHAEEVKYLWRVASDHNKVTTNDLVTRKRLVKLWTNFAKYGNPTPTPDPLFENLMWPFAHANTLDLRYMNINSTLNLSTDPNWKSFVFWTDLFNEYGNPPYSTY